MDKKKFLNTKYASLCQQLGDAQIKSDQLIKHIEDLKSQIHSLNKSFTIMEEYELVSKSANSNEQA